MRRTHNTLEGKFRLPPKFCEITENEGRLNRLLQVKLAFSHGQLIAGKTDRYRL